jgi:uncharacterized protein (TIGR02996 family)
MATTQESALLRAVYADPHDDAPRLVYADWLDETGQRERAEFIRVQIALTNVADDDPRRPALEKRERQLLKAHGKGWKASDHPWLRGAGFERGFLMPKPRVMTGKQFAALDPEQFGAAPLWDVRLTKVAKCAEQVAASPCLARLRGLYMEEEYDFGDAGATALAASPYLGNLTTLSLVSCGVHEEGTEAIVAAPGLSRLTALNLTDARMTDRGVFALAAARHLNRLRVLRIGYSPSGGLSTGPEAFRAFCANPALANLTELDAGRRVLGGDEAARALAEATFLPTLRDLSLEWNGVRAAGLRALLRSPKLGRLRRLELSGNPLGDEVGGLLQRCKKLDGLTALGLRQTGITNGAIFSLVRAPQLANLTELTLDDRGITVYGARALLEAPHLQRLSKVRIVGERIDRACKAALQARWGKDVCG